MISFNETIQDMHTERRGIAEGVESPRVKLLKLLRKRFRAAATLHKRESNKSNSILLKADLNGVVRGFDEAAGIVDRMLSEESK